MFGLADRGNKIKVNSVWVMFSAIDPVFGGGAGKGPGIFLASAGHMTPKHPEFVGVLN